MQASTRTQATQGGVHECQSPTGTDRQSDATYIVLPPQRVQRNRVHVLIKDERERDHKVEDTEAFGPEVERQDLDRV